MYSWQRSKGISKETVCPKCHKSYKDDEYDFEEDECLFCLFPETSPLLPTEKNEFQENETGERRLLDELDYIPEVQSEASKRSYTKYKQGRKRKA